MKGIVAEINNNKATVLRKDGSFAIVKYRSGMQVGAEVDTSKLAYAGRSALMRSAAIAASFLIIFGTGYGVYSYSTPYSYINVDGEPSIELVANRYGIVIDAVPLNIEGEELIEKLPLIYKSVEKSIDEILQSRDEEKDKDKDIDLDAAEANTVILSISGKDDAGNEKMKKRIESSVEEKNAGSEDAGRDSVISETASIEEYEKAKSEGLSPGKMKLIEKAIEASPEKSYNELKDKSVDAIVKSIRASEKMREKAGNEENKQIEEQKSQEQESQEQGSEESGNEEPMNRNRNNNGNTVNE